MLQAAEEPSSKTPEEGGSSQTTEGTEENAVPKRKAKTKIGNKSKKKRKVKSTGKFPDGEEQYEVSDKANNSLIIRFNIFLFSPLSIKIIAKFVNKVEKSSSAIPVHALITWYVWIRNLRIPLKEDGVVRIARMKDPPNRTTMSIKNFVECVKTEENYFVVIRVLRRIILSA